MDLTNQQFNDLIARRPLERDKFGNRIWRCECVCGREVDVSQSHLRAGNTKSCGCRRARANTARNIARVKHGHGRNGGQTSTYRTWRSMISRCENPKADQYPLYGGRGITVCTRWRNSFELFLEDMGERPVGMTIDRRDPNGNYVPDNCRWSTEKQQSNNKRNNVVLEFKGEKKTLAQWSEALGIKHSALRMRLSSGWSVEKTLGTPLKVRSSSAR